jgi:hypothetical protein
LDAGARCGCYFGHSIDDPGDGLIRNSSQSCDIVNGNVLFLGGKPHGKGE